MYTTEVIQGTPFKIINGYSNVVRIRNIVRQGGKVYSFVKGLNYLYVLTLHLDFSIRCNNRHKHCANYISINIRCGNACLPDFRNLCDIVNVGWKRKYIDR